MVERPLNDFLSNSVDDGDHHIADFTDIDCLAGAAID
jgi:hypothetical protein